MQISKSDIAQEENFPLLRESHTLSAVLCFAGFLAHLLLSGPLLNSWGLHYASDDGGFYEKIHPGSWLILLSAVVFLLESGSPLAQIIRTVRDYTIFTTLFFLYLLLIIYVALRSGVAGLALLPDTHLPVVISAIVLSCAPRRICYYVILCLVVIGTANSMIGIMESVGHFRIFTFDPDWVVLQEQNFRASALMGHPLSNAMFTSVLIFIVLALRLPVSVKTLLVSIYFISLIGFGGRSGLLYSVAGISLIGLMAFKQQCMKENLSVGKLFISLVLAIIVPALFFAGIALVLGSGIGQRVLAHARWDESANARFLALKIFHFMTMPEILFGMPPERIVDIAYRMNLTLPLSDIENPWLLMLMFFGCILFPLWLLGTGLFMWRLMQNQPWAIKLAVLGYYITASTSNSFGRKDSVYTIMVCAVICASVLLREARPEPDAV